MYNFVRYQKELDDQMQLLQEEQAKIFDQFLKEKQMIDNIVAKIQQENEINTLRNVVSFQVNPGMIPKKCYDLALIMI